MFQQLLVDMICHFHSRTINRVEKTRCKSLSCLSYPVESTREAYVIRQKRLPARDMYHHQTTIKIRRTKNSIKSPRDKFHLQSSTDGYPFAVPLVTYIMKDEKEEEEERRKEKGGKKRVNAQRSLRFLRARRYLFGRHASHPSIQPECRDTRSIIPIPTVM